MKNRHFLICAVSIMAVFLAGCGSNDSDDDYVSYSQESVDTSIAENVETVEDTSIITEDVTETEDTTTEDVTTSDDDLESTSTDDNTDTTSADESKKDTSSVTTTGATTTTAVTTTAKATTTKATQKQTQNNSNNNSNNNQQNNNNNQVNVAQTEQPNQVEETNAPVQETPSFSESDMYVTLNGFSFTVNIGMDELLAYLGDAYDLRTAPSCYYDGDDRTYTYSDFTIYTYSYDGATYYCQEVELTSGNVSTNKGIRIGSSLEEVENAYGNGYQIVGNEYRFYSSGNTYMYFFLSNGVVNSLGYRVDIDE